MQLSLFEQFATPQPTPVPACLSENHPSPWPPTRAPLAHPLVTVLLWSPRLTRHCLPAPWRPPHQRSKRSQHCLLALPPEAARGGAVKGTPCLYTGCPTTHRPRTATMRPLLGTSLLMAAANCTQWLCLRWRHRGCVAARMHSLCPTLALVPKALRPALLVPGLGVHAARPLTPFTPAVLDPGLLPVSHTRTYARLGSATCAL